MPNPDPQPSIPRAISGREVLGMLSAASRQGIMAAGLLPHLDDLAWAQARDRIAAWIDDILAPSGIVSADDAAAVKAYLAATDPDPSWSPAVPGPSWANRAFPGVEFTLSDGRIVSGQVTAEMVAEARS